MSEGDPKKERKMTGKERSGGSRFRAAQTITAIQNRMEHVDESLEKLTGHLDESLGEVRGILRDSFGSLSDTLDELVEHTLEEQFKGRFAVDVGGVKMALPDAVASHETRLRWIEDNFVDKHGRPPRKK